MRRTDMIIEDTEKHPLDADRTRFEKTMKSKSIRHRRIALISQKKRFSLSVRNPMAKRRTCLMCGKRFLSKGPHNRRCKKCNQKIAQAGENAFYVPRMYSLTHQFVESSGEFE